MPLVLGVDSSTQATKIEVRDADSGELVAEGRAPHPATTPPCSEQHPDAWWQALQQAMTGIPRVHAIAVAGQQHGLVALDARSDVIRPAKLWNDTESAPDATWLRSKLGDEAWARATGSVPVASFTVTKLSWLHRSEPDAWKRLARVCLPHDWLTWKLTGSFVTDRGDASGTGYFSPVGNAYREDILAIVDADWSAELPHVCAPLEHVGDHDGAVVAPGTGDNMAAALGAGLQPGDVAMSIGTSGTVFAVSDTPSADATGAVAGFADATGRFLPLVCTLNATKVTDAIARLLGVDHARLDALALDAPAGANGLTIVPYLDGERTPDRPDATGTIVGLRSDVGREELARAAYEGVVCGLLDGLDALPVRPARIVLLGGGARAQGYRRAVADLSGLPVVVPEAAEHVAAGACLQAAAVLHREWPRWKLGTTETIDPDSRVDRVAIRDRYRRAAG